MRARYSIKAMIAKTHGSEGVSSVSNADNLCSNLRALVGRNQETVHDQISENEMSEVVCCKLDLFSIFLQSPLRDCHDSGVVHQYIDCFYHVCQLCGGLSHLCEKGKSTPNCLDTVSALLVDRAVRTSSDGPWDDSSNHSFAKAIWTDTSNDKCVQSLSRTARNEPYNLMPDLPLIPFMTTSTTCSDVVSLPYSGCEVKDGEDNGIVGCAR